MNVNDNQDSCGSVKVSVAQVSIPANTSDVGFAFSEDEEGCGDHYSDKQNLCNSFVLGPSTCSLNSTLEDEQHGLEEGGACYGSNFDFPSPTVSEEDAFNYIGGKYSKYHSNKRQKIAASTEIEYPDSESNDNNTNDKVYLQHFSKRKKRSNQTYQSKSRLKRKARIAQLKLDFMKSNKEKIDHDSGSNDGFCLSSIQAETNSKAVYSDTNSKHQSNKQKSPKKSRKKSMKGVGYDENTNNNDDQVGMKSPLLPVIPR